MELHYSSIFYMIELTTFQEIFPEVIKNREIYTRIYFSI